MSVSNDTSYFKYIRPSQHHINVPEPNELYYELSGINRCIEEIINRSIYNQEQYYRNLYSKVIQEIKYIFN